MKLNRRDRIIRLVWGMLIQASLDIRHVDCDALAEKIGKAVDSDLFYPRGDDNE